MPNTFTSGTSFPRPASANPAGTDASRQAGGGLYTSPIRWGKGNNAQTNFGNSAADLSATRELFLKQFSGQVLTAFNQRQELEGKCPTYSANAKSVQFPRTGISVAGYHTAGEEMVGDDFATGELTITADALLVSKHEFYDLDSNFAHFDIHAQSADQMGQALANMADQSKFKQLVRAARSVGNQAGDNRFPTGSVFASKELDRFNPDETDAEITASVNADGFTSTTKPTASQEIEARKARREDYKKLADATGSCYDGWAYMRWLRRAQSRFFQMKVPVGTMFHCFVPYDVYDAIKYAYTRKDGGAGGEYINQNRDFTGDAVSGFVSNDLSGIPIDSIMVMPSFNMPTGADERNDAITLEDEDNIVGYVADLPKNASGKYINNTFFKYRNNFRKTKGIIFATGAIGTLNYGGVKFEHTRDTRRLADFYVANTLFGHGTLRREMAIELSSYAPVLKADNTLKEDTNKLISNVALDSGTIFANG